MRVLHVINRLSGSGAETSLRDIVIGTSGTSLHHTLVLFTPDGNRLEGLPEAGVEVVTPPRPLDRWADRTGHVRRAIERTRPDLVHTSLFEADVAGRIAARMSRVPCVTSLVNTPYDDLAVAANGVPRWKLSAVRTADRLLARHATSTFHAITHAAAEAAVRDLGIDPARIRVVPRGRDASRLGRRTADRRIEVRRRLDIDATRPVVVNVARQEPQKGLVHLIDAVAALRPHLPDILLLQIGRTGNSSDHVAQRLRGHHLGDHVRFLGRREDIGDLLAAGDAFAFPSLYEGLGGAVLEAMAVGLPVVASDIPALREVLADGRCGRLVTPADPLALATGLEAVLTDARLADRLATQAHRRFEQHYDLAVCLAGMRELYLDLGAASRVPSRQDRA